MAEVVGIVAAAVQFAAVGNKLLNSIARLKGFKEKPKRLQSQVSQLLALTTAIQSKLHSEPSDSLSQQVESVLLECTTQGQRMAQLLDNLAITPQDSIAGRKWKTILGLTKEKQFEDICDHLERHKTFLNLYIVNANR
jgi:hypothetical protein